jgi:hypothetical protein
MRGHIGSRSDFVACLSYAEAKLRLRAGNRLAVAPFGNKVAAGQIPMMFEQINSGVVE